MSAPAPPRRPCTGVVGLPLLVLLVLAPLLVLVPLVLGGSPASARPAQDGDLEELALVAQTPTVAPEGTFEARVRLDGIPADGQVELVLHGRVRSRSELDASLEGSSLRSTLRRTSTAIAALPVAPDGSHRVTLSLDPAAPNHVRITTPGAYPLVITAKDAAGTPVAQLITHLLVEPGADDESPPLAVAVLAELGAPPALQPDGRIDLPPEAIEGDVALAEALAAVPDVAATISVVPETLDAQAAGGDGAAPLVEALQAASPGRSVLLRPYVDASLDALVDARLDEQLRALLARGRLLLTDVLGVAPDDDVWIADPDLGADGLAALEALDVDHVVVDPDQVEPVSSTALSLAETFLLAPPGDRTEPSSLDAIAVDPRIRTRLDDDVSDAVLAHHLLAELAVLWLEQPGVPRGVVVPVDGDTPAEAVQVLLAGLEGSQMLGATTLGQLFDDTGVLLDAGDEPVDRALDPEDPEAIGRNDATAITAAWRHLQTFEGVVGTDSPRIGAVADHLLVALGDDVPTRARGEHVAAATAQMAEVTDAIGTTDRTTITLTARDGTVPLTLRNDAGIPVNVVIHLRSAKLEFPEGEAISMTLTEETTRLAFAVRARASGAFPLDIEVTSPDGTAVLATTRYTVQSTAVSGAGLVLSVGALLFLVVWWARHWHKTRRSRKLVDARHLAG